MYQITIPNNTKINCLAWSSEQGWIGVGGDDGLLKVLKRKDSKNKGLVTTANLSMNQNLEGHAGKVQVITWNEHHQKLTTSDQNGLIIVWMLYKGSWYEEMINNRNKSVVKGMAWDSEGQKICIVYEDGAVIVGSVDGNRIWGKELKGAALSGVQWSPDGKLLIFSLKNSEIHVYDNQGGFMMKINIQCLPPPVVSGVLVVAMTWYDGRNGYVDQNCPSLAICYQTGHIQIMRGHEDDNPVIMDTGINAVGCCWNHNGSILAISGSAVIPDENSECNVVQFYTPFGEHMRTLKIPGRNLTSCAWEGGSLRVALSVDSYIYFAIIRPDYKWSYFAKTLVYSFSHPGRPGTQITFWNTTSNEFYHKTVKSLYGLAAYKEHCVLAVRTDDPHGQYGLLLCNSIATPVDTKYMELEPLWVALNSTHVFAASKDHFLIWHFITPKSHSTLGLAGSRHRKERLYHIDDTPSGVAEVIQDLDRNYQVSFFISATSDPICCLAASDKILVIGRESGSLQRYSLPQVALVQRYSLTSRPNKLAINCDSTRLSVIDATGVFTFVDLDGGVAEVGRVERRDVWVMMWAADNPDLIAIMEKTRMYVIRGTEPEEPIMSSGYICSFQELEIRAVLLDEIMANPESPSVEQHILDLEVKSLRDTRELLDKVGIKEATAFIEANPHPRLWQLLAEAAVRKLDLPTAEAAFVRCSDYPGIQLVKRLANVTNDQLKRAQVAAYFNDFNEAERLYLEADRRDLAILLREKLGDWFRVVQLMKMGTGSSDSQIQTAWNSVGDYFAERNNWESAKEYYEKAVNTERLIECYQILEEYDSLENCVLNLPEKHPLLKEIADIFVSVGMCSQAVTTFVKCGMVQNAVEACVSLNQWDQAVALAETHAMLPQIASLLDRYATSLLEKDRHLEAVHLYRKANRYLEAAKLLFKTVKEEVEKKSKPLRIKKLYVLAALLVEEHLKQREKSIQGDKSTLLIESFDDANGLDYKTMDNAWRGAEAYHFFMLAQRQLYDGHAESAMITCLKLKHYDDIIGPEEIYCLLALASCMCKAFGTASKAFMKLETIQTLDNAKKEEYADLAMAIFTRHAPRDYRTSYVSCPTCTTPIPSWSGICPNCDTRYPACIVTGKTLTDLTVAWTCKSCKHSAAYNDISTKQYCPLCHFPVRNQ
ncbi:hypothetical protein AAG570_001795 [Ranatra chinensis]|uniref:WD repeat-containing protein 55 homolog n=1 Tax=Ranatra chinensis TaxID=642074 RepID=A0ABD0Y9L6_9HEMI